MVNSETPYSDFFKSKCTIGQDWIRTKTRRVLSGPGFYSVIDYKDTDGNVYTHYHGSTYGFLFDIDYIVKNDKEIVQDCCIEQPIIKRPV